MDHRAARAHPRRAPSHSDSHATPELMGV